MSGPVLIAGGYGLVGGQAAELLRERHPELSLVLAGRHPENGRMLSERLGRASCAPMDVTETGNPLGGLSELPAAVLATVNDPHDALLQAVLDHGVPYVDVTRWTALVRRSLVRSAATPPRAPVLLASGWMGGVVPLLVAWAARNLTEARAPSPRGSASTTAPQPRCWRRLGGSGSCVPEQAPNPGAAVAVLVAHRPLRER